jgi:acyl-coenzyme A thioesterase PaaI-like protein
VSKVADVAEQAMQGLAPGARMFDLKVNYISDFGPGEELEGHAEVVHAGRRTVVTECRIAAGARLVATATATFAVSGEKE